jgi:TMEM175 potassium channel family protein
LIHVFCLPAGLVSTYAGIALLVLLQLNSAIAPQVRPLDRF